MKYIYVIVLLAALGFGCTREPLELGNIVQSKSTQVHLDLDLPAADTVITYSAADDAANENALVTLDVFAFDWKGDIVAGNEGHVTFNNINLIDGKGRAIAPVTIDKDSTFVMRQFGVIANGDPSKIKAITTKKQFIDFVIDATTMPTRAFVMSELSALNSIGSVAPTINLSLRRAVARIDVVLGGSVTNFEITSARLINVRTKGYLNGKLTDENDGASPVLVPTASGLANYETVSAGSDANLKRNFASRLYCLENYNETKEDPTKSTSVIIGGLYKGATYYYRVNLYDRASFAQVRRNYIYRINVNRVNGPGNTNADAAINDSPQNIDVSVEELPAFSASNIVYDGKNYIGVSKSELTMAKSAGGTSIDVLSNLPNWDATFCTKEGVNAPKPTWVSLNKREKRVEFTLTKNDDAQPRVAYAKIAVSGNARLAIIVTIQQYHIESALISFTPSVITVSATKSEGEFGTKITIVPAGATWKIESLNMLDDKNQKWCRIADPLLVGSGGVTGQPNETIDLKFNISAMNAALISRTAVVSVSVTDISGFKETKTVTISQSTASSALSVSRIYIAKTAESDIEKIAVNSTVKWTAKFMNRNGANAPSYGCDWLQFLDDQYRVLGEGKEASGLGAGAIYVKFDNCPANTVRNGYIEVTNGTITHRIHVHQGDYRSVIVDGYEMLDRNLGAISTGFNNVNANGYYYQWGRRPDGYQLNVAAVYQSASNAATRVQRQPTYGDPAYNSYIMTNNGAMTTDLTTGLSSMPATAHEWLVADPSLTPTDQRDTKKLWDARAIASDNISDTNLTPVRTDYDPCPDGWRVPSAREMENIFVYGVKKLGVSEGAHNIATVRRISTDNGGDMTVPNSTNRYWFMTGSGNYRNDPVYQASSTTTHAGWYWTSSFSASGGPYAMRIMNDDIPEVMWSPRLPKRTAPKVYPNDYAAVDNVTSMAMPVRCIRDRRIIEELVVNVRRKTINSTGQGVSVLLTTTELNSSWTASSDSPWLTVSPSSGSSGTDLSLTAVENRGDTRTGAIRITTPAGTVATVVIVQLDESGAMFGTASTNNIRWWRTRNVGATRSDFKAIDDDNVGYFYFWGTNMSMSAIENKSYAYPSYRTTGRLDSWNLSSAPSQDRGVAFCSTAWLKAWGNLPYPVKNHANDPCPEGWRVPTYQELLDTFGSGITSSNKPIYAPSQEWANMKVSDASKNLSYFTAAGDYRNHVTISNSGKAGMYLSSTSAGIGIYNDGFNYQFYGLKFAPTSTGSIASMDLFGTDNSGTGKATMAGLIRCVQEMSDTLL